MTSQGVPDRPLSSFCDSCCLRQGVGAERKSLPASYNPLEFHTTGLHQKGKELGLDDGRGEAFIILIFKRCFSSFPKGSLLLKWLCLMLYLSRGSCKGRKWEKGGFQSHL